MHLCYYVNANQNKIVIILTSHWFSFSIRMGSVIAAIFTVIIKPFQYKDIAVLNVYFCMCAYVDGWMVCECTRVGQTLTEALFLYHLPPYCFEVGSPTESGAHCLG